MKTGDKRSVFVDSGEDTRVPVDARISDRGELVISTTGSFESSKPIKIIVTIPAGELEGVSISPSGGALIVEGEIEQKSGVFNASSVGGVTDLIVQNLKADHVYLASSGASRVFLVNKDFPDAKVGTAHLVAGETSSGFIFGADNVDLLLEGTADVAVDPRPGGNITGVALGTNSVFATAKNTSMCNVGGPVFGQACVPVRGALRQRLSPPVFTCGIAALGPFQCPISSGEAGREAQPGSAERMGAAQASLPSKAEGVATGGKRRLSQMKGAAASSSSALPKLQVPVLACNGSAAFMRRCDAALDDLKMAGAQVESGNESA